MNIRDFLAEMVRISQPVLILLQIFLLHHHIGAIGYFETSALTCRGLSEAMTGAIRAVFAVRRGGPSQKKFTWPWKRYVLIWQQITIANYKQQSTRAIDVIGLYDCLFLSFSYTNALMLTVLLYVIQTFFTLYSYS